MAAMMAEPFQLPDTVVDPELVDIFHRLAARIDAGDEQAIASIRWAHRAALLHDWLDDTGEWSPR